jgi:hypothetical protein
MIKFSYSAVEEAKKATAKAKEDLADAVATAERGIVEEAKNKEGDENTPPKHH